MIPASEDRSSTDIVNGGDPHVDSLVLSLLRAYCERIPALPSDLRYLEIGGPHAPVAWRTRCISDQFAARGVLLSPTSKLLVNLKEDRPRDIVIHGRLGESDDTSLEAPAESSSPDAEKNDENVVPAPRWILDDLVEHESSLNRLDHLVIHGDPGALWDIRSCEFRVVRPYILHVTSTDSLGQEHISVATTHFGRRDFVLIAVRPRDLIFLDSLAFLRPEQSSSFIV